jgi:hypothetical protein
MRLSSMKKQVVHIVEKGVTNIIYSNVAKKKKKTIFKTVSELD